MGSLAATLRRGSSAATDRSLRGRPSRRRDIGDPAPDPRHESAGVAEHSLRGRLGRRHGATGRRSVRSGASHRPRSDRIQLTAQTPYPSHQYFDHAVEPFANG